MIRAGAIRIHLGLVALGLAALAQSARAEGFVDLYVGAAFPIETDVEIRSGPSAGPLAVTSRSSPTLENSVVPGGRGGYWIGALPWLGVALDVSYFYASDKAEPAADQLYSLSVLPLSGLLMLRYPLLVDSAFPNGRFYPYVAAGPAMFRSRAAGFGGGPDSSIDLGLDARAGFKVFHESSFWSVFAEYRFTRFEPPTYADDRGGMRYELELDTQSTHHMIFGVGFHF